MDDGEENWQEDRDDGGGGDNGCIYFLVNQDVKIKKMYFYSTKWSFEKKKKKKKKKNRIDEKRLALYLFITMLLQYETRWAIRIKKKKSTNR